MKKILPTLKQFKKWSLPSKYTAISFFISIILYTIPTSLLWSYEKLEGYSLNNLKIKENNYTFKFNNEIYKSDITNTEIKREYTKFDITYPQIDSFISNDFINSINYFLKENILNAYQENLLEYVSDYEIGIVSPDLLSIKWSQYTYYYPAANGDSSILAINVVPNKKHYLQFFDIFDAKLNALEHVKEMIKHKNESENGCEFNENFYKTNFIPRFFIKNEGIEFIFSEYEVTPGMCGSFNVFLEHKRLENNYRQDGPLGVFIKTSRTWNATDHFVNSVMSTYEKLKNE